MSNISALSAKQILDSRGIPTVECSLWLDTGHMVTASVPSGTSKGKYEALEIRDNKTDFMNGQGVTTVINNINTIIAPQLIGKNPLEQQEIDQLLINLDGTPNKSKLGANATNAVSYAVLKAGALIKNQPIYYYLMEKYQLASTLIIPNCIYTVINGGEHGADNLDLQEFELIPASFIDYPNSLNMAVNLFHRLEEILIAKGAIHSVGIVGGFTPNLFNNTDAFEILVETIKASPYTFAQDLFFGCDVSASSLSEGSKYRLKDKSQAYSSKDFLEYFKQLRNAYHVFYLEDPFAEDDIESWQNLTAEIGSTTMVVGDSLLAGNLERVKKAISDKSCNAMLVKINQTGTISETINVIKEAKAAGWQVIVSHRSGETNDTLVADFAVGLGADYVKFGPPNRGERVAKYNRLMEIYTDLQYYASANQNQTQTSSTNV